MDYYNNQQVTPEMKLADLLVVVCLIKICAVNVSGGERSSLETSVDASSDWAMGKIKNCSDYLSHLTYGPRSGASAAVGKNCPSL